MEVFPEVLVNDLLGQLPTIRVEDARISPLVQKELVVSRFNLWPTVEIVGAHAVRRVQLCPQDRHEYTYRLHSTELEVLTLTLGERLVPMLFVALGLRHSPVHLVERSGKSRFNHEHQLLTGELHIASVHTRHRIYSRLMIC